jgi:hypothetical protein
MADQTSHDQLFKEVLGEFFPEFMELFFPQMAEFLDWGSLEFLPVELFTDLLEGDTFETDVIVKARFRGEESCFIVHVEHQGEFKAGFDWRMFNYFSLLHRDYGLPVYPIVIFSHRSPRAVGDRSYSVSLGGVAVQLPGDSVESFALAGFCGSGQSCGECVYGEDEGEEGGSVGCEVGVFAGVDGVEVESGAVTFVAGVCGYVFASG